MQNNCRYFPTLQRLLPRFCIFKVHLKLVLLHCIYVVSRIVQPVSRIVQPGLTEEQEDCSRRGTKDSFFNS